MQTAIKDSKGNSLRPGYRVKSLEGEANGREGRVVGLSPPFSVTVEWDDGDEATVGGRMVEHLSKLS